MRVPVGDPRAAARQLGTPATTAAPDLYAQLTPEQLFDSLAIRVGAPSCWDETLRIDVALIDGATHRLTLRNGVLTHTSAPQPEDADMTLTLSRAALLGVATGQIGPERFADAGVEASGDPGVLQRLLVCLQDPDPYFPILTPAEV